MGHIFSSELLPAAPLQQAAQFDNSQGPEIFHPQCPFNQSSETQTAGWGNQRTYNLCEAAAIFKGPWSKLKTTSACDQLIDRRTY